MKEHRSITGDSTGVNHLNPMGVSHVPQVFLQKHNGTGGGHRMDLNLCIMADDILQLIDWINKNVEMDLFNHSATEAHVQETLELWKECDSDIFEFQLMVVLQVLLLAGVWFKPSHDLHNLVHPVVTFLGAAAQLAHVEKSLHHTSVTVFWLMNEFDLHCWGRNADKACVRHPPRGWQKQGTFSRKGNVFSPFPVWVSHLSNSLQSVSGRSCQSKIAMVL